MLFQDQDFRLLEAKAQSSPRGQGVKDANLMHSEPLTLSALNHSVSHHCGYKPSWGHVRQDKYWQSISNDTCT